MSGEIQRHINHTLSGEQWELFHYQTSWCVCRNYQQTQQLPAPAASLPGFHSITPRSTGDGGTASPHLNMCLYYQLLPFIHSKCLIQAKVTSWQCCCPLWPHCRSWTAPGSVPSWPGALLTLRSNITWWDCKKKPQKHFSASFSQRAVL